MSTSTFSAESPIVTESPSRHDSVEHSVKRSDDADFPRQIEQTRPFTDEDREAAIQRAGDALIAAHGREDIARRKYAASSCLLDKADQDVAAADARRALTAMQALIRGRSDKAVRKFVEGRVA